jgi:hypothetical protein
MVDKKKKTSAVRNSGRPSHKPDAQGKTIAAPESVTEPGEMFRSIVENSHAGIFIIDDSFHMTYANEKLSQLLGIHWRSLPVRIFVSSWTSRASRWSPTGTSGGSGAKPCPRATKSAACVKTVRV